MDIFKTLNSKCKNRWLILMKSYDKMFLIKINEHAKIRVKTFER